LSSAAASAAGVVVVVGIFQTAAAAAAAAAHNLFIDSQATRSTWSGHVDGRTDERVLQAGPARPGTA